MRHREPNRYQVLKDEHEAARQRGPEAGGGILPAAPPPYEPTLEELIEAKLAAYEFVEGPKVEAGRVSKQDYFRALRQLESDLSREIQELPTQSEYSPALGGPTLSAEQAREAAINPEQTHEQRLSAEAGDKLTKGREMDQRTQERFERLLEVSSDERLMRYEQEIGHSPSRGRSP